MQKHIVMSCPKLPTTPIVSFWVHCTPTILYWNSMQIWPINSIKNSISAAIVAHQAMGSTSGFQVQNLVYAKMLPSYASSSTKSRLVCNINGQFFIFSLIASINELSRLTSLTPHLRNWIINKNNKEEI